jgi:hypothetical protein
MDNRHMGNPHTGDTQTMEAILSDENRSSYVQTDNGRILAAGLSKQTALKFAAVNSFIRLAQAVVTLPQGTVGNGVESVRVMAQAALNRAGITSAFSTDNSDSL